MVFWWVLLKATPKTAFQDLRDAQAKYSWCIENISDTLPVQTSVIVIVSWAQHYIFPTFPLQVFNEYISLTFMSQDPSPRTIIAENQIRYGILILVDLDIFHNLLAKRKKTFSLSLSFCKKMFFCNVSEPTGGTTWFSQYKCVHCKIFHLSQPVHLGEYSIHQFHTILYSLL